MSPSNPSSSPAGTVLWKVQTADGRQFGPVDEATLRQWVAAQRIGPNDLVWRSGWQTWQSVQSVFGVVGKSPSRQNAERRGHASRWKMPAVVIVAGFVACLVLFVVVRWLTKEPAVMVEKLAESTPLRRPSATTARPKPTAVASASASPRPSSPAKPTAIATAPIAVATPTRSVPPSASALPTAQSSAAVTSSPPPPAAPPPLPTTEKELWDIFVGNWYGLNRNFGSRVRLELEPHVKGGHFGSFSDMTDDVHWIQLFKPNLSTTNATVSDKDGDVVAKLLTPERLEVSFVYKYFGASFSDRKKVSGTYTLVKHIPAVPERERALLSRFGRATATTESISGPAKEIVKWNPLLKNRDWRSAVDGLKNQSLAEKLPPVLDSLVGVAEAFKDSTKADSLFVDLCLIFAVEKPVPWDALKKELGEPTSDHEQGFFSSSGSSGDYSVSKPATGNATPVVWQEYGFGRLRFGVVDGQVVVLGARPMR